MYHIVWLLVLGIFPSLTCADNLTYHAHYDARKNILHISIVKAFAAFWSVEFIEQGNYQIRLHQASPYTGNIPDVYAYFDTERGLLVVPELNAQTQYWTATFRLQDKDLLRFSLLSAQPMIKPAEPLTAAKPTEQLSPAQRYLLNAEGTVTDTVTHLQWMRCSYGQTWNGNSCVGAHLKVSMQAAAYAAFNTKFAGHADWRLPSIDELKSLVYCSSGKPAFWNTTGFSCSGIYQVPTLYASAFPDSASVYWSGTPLQADPGEDNTLTVSFNYGHVYYSYFKGDYESARFVRGPSLAAEFEVVGGFKE